MNQMETIDYKELLKKYIAHVGFEEGSTFIDQIFEGKGFMSDIYFSKEEVQELKNLEKLNEDELKSEK